MKAMVVTGRALLWSLALLAPGKPLGAHQLDEYLQATLVAIEPGDIRLQINLTPGVAVAEKVLALIDLDHDGLISKVESMAYAERLKNELAIRLDRRPVQLTTIAFLFPDPDVLRTGWGIIQIEYSVATGPLAPGSHRLSLENHHLPLLSAYLLNAALPKSSSIEIRQQNRNVNQASGEIAFDFLPARGSFRSAAPLISLAALVLALLAAAWLTRRYMRAAQ
jgi:hypothetical protein